MKIEDVKVLRNPIRTGEKDDFTKVNYRCGYCDDYHSVVACLERMPKGFPINGKDDDGEPIAYVHICKSCLLTMVGAIDKNYRDNFQSDFDKVRGNDHVRIEN